MVHRTVTYNRLAEIQYKTLQRLHIAPVTHNKISGAISPICRKCKTDLWTHFHQFWGCNWIARYWSHIAKELSVIFKTTIRKDPGLLILGLPSKELALPHNHYKLLDKLLLLARKCILLKWVKDTPPSVTIWYREIFSVLPHERISAVLRGNEGLFLKIWNPVLDYLPSVLKHTRKVSTPSGWKQTMPSAT